MSISKDISVLEQKEAEYLEIFEDAFPGIAGVLQLSALTQTRFNELQKDPMGMVLIRLLELALGRITITRLREKGLEAGEL